jgi:hypothetical protein
MRLLHRFLTLAADERRLLVKASFLLAMIRLGLGLVPFTTLRRMAVGRTRSGGRSANGDRLRADQIVWAVTVISDRVPGWTTCLSRALTVHAMLARSGHPSRLHVGVVRGRHRELEGHAWVEREGRILIGGSASEVAHFARLAAFDVEVT